MPVTQIMRRPTPVALCQDVDTLLGIRRYDFDLNDPAFREYADRRGVLYLAGTPGSPQWRFVADHDVTEADFLGEPSFHVSIGAHRYTDDDMATHWKIMRIAKAKLQDCWDIFTGRTGWVDAPGAGIDYLIG
jgi:hypothetical protein